MMAPEDVVLFLADPNFAAELGIEAPLCVKCGGEIREPPSDWDGENPLRHLIPLVCERNTEAHSKGADE